MVHNILLKMFNLSNIQQTANIKFKNIVDKRFVRLQHIQIVQVTSTLL